MKDKLVTFNNGFVAGLAVAVAAGFVGLVWNGGLNLEYTSWQMIGAAAIAMTVAIVATWHGRRSP